MSANGEGGKQKGRKYIYTDAAIFGRQKIESKERLARKKEVKGEASIKERSEVEQKRPTIKKTSPEEEKKGDSGLVKHND